MTLILTAALSVAQQLLATTRLISTVIKSNTWRLISPPPDTIGAKKEKKRKFLRWFRESVCNWGGQETGKARRPPRSSSRSPALPQGDHQGVAVGGSTQCSVHQSVRPSSSSPAAAHSFPRRGEIFAAGGVDEAGVGAPQLPEGPAGGVRGAAGDLGSKRCFIDSFSL